MAAGQRPAARVIGARAPDRQGVIGPVDHPLGAPKHEQGAGDLALQVGAVVRQVDAGGGAVVLADGVNGFRVAEAALVFGKRLLGEGRFTTRLLPGGHFLVHVVVRISTDQPLGQIERLDQEEPVVIGAGEGHVRVLVHVERRRDVEHRRLGDPLGVVEGHAVGDPRAPVVADHGEALEAEGGHDLDLVLGHGALGIGRVVVAARRLGAVAVAAQVGQHHGEALGQARRNLVPHDVGLGVAVEQQQRRPGARLPDVDLGARGRNAGPVEAVEHGNVILRFGH